MNQKNRLLREAYALLLGITSGDIKPLGYTEHMYQAVELRDRIAKNLSRPIAE